MAMFNSYILVCQRVCLHLIRFTCVLVYFCSYLSCNISCQTNTSYLDKVVFHDQPRSLSDLIDAIVVFFWAKQPEEMYEMHDFPSQKNSSVHLGESQPSHFSGLAGCSSA